MKFPKHECGLFLTHNEHKDYYQTAAERIEEIRSLNGGHGFKTTEAKQRCIDTNELWELQWYPRTPISSYHIAAPTLEEVLEYALEVEAEENEPSIDR